MQKQEGWISLLHPNCPLDLQQPDDECPKGVGELAKGLDGRTG